MKKNSAAAALLDRLHNILDELDEISMGEETDELNAQLEDSLFLMESISEDDEDAQEETEGAIEELEDILEEYRALSEAAPELSQKVIELEMAVKMARMNLVG